MSSEDDFIPFHIELSLNEVRATKYLDAAPLLLFSQRPCRLINKNISV